MVPQNPSQVRGGPKNTYQGGAGGWENLQVVCGRILYDPPLRVMEIKTKKTKWDLIKLKRFCTTKEMISKVKI